ncbi:MAG: hypothetical protein FWD23_16225, partial [Oscillospiraceae bacterium]|nr:hypothetical protein [Oscillospiraceae bacterium]
RFGYISERLYYDPLYFSAGLRIIERDEKGMPMISPKMNGERVTGLTVKLADFIHNNNDTFGHIAHDTSLLECETIFKEGRGMFIASTLTYAENHLRNVGFDYGILPMPKFTEDQQNYSTCTGFPYTLYAIAADSRQPEAAAAVLETFASEGYRRITPAVFETAMKVKYSRDEESALMYDIIREGVIFDLGRIFTATFNNLTFSMFRSSIADNNTNWVSTFERNEPALQRSLESIINAFNE